MNNMDEAVDAALKLIAQAPKGTCYMVFVTLEGTRTTRVLSNLDEDEMLMLASNYVEQRRRGQVNTELTQE